MLLKLLSLLLLLLLLILLLLLAAAATLLGEDSLLVVADPDRHKYLRTLLQPAFNADAIATYLPDIQSLIEWHLASWEAAGSQGVKAYECLKTLTFEFILQVSQQSVTCNMSFLWPDWLIQGSDMSFYSMSFCVARTDQLDPSLWLVAGRRLNKCLVCMVPIALNACRHSCCTMHWQVSC